MENIHVNNKLLLYHLGELKDQDMNQVAEHLKTCSKCSFALNEIRLTMAVIDEEKKMEVNPFLYTRIEQKLNELKTEKGRNKTVPSLNIILKPVYIVVFILVAAFIGMFVWNNLKINQNSKTKTTVYSINTTKDFYILGVDDSSY